MSEGDDAWYRGAAIAALNLHVHTLARLIELGVLTGADAKDIIDRCLLDFEDRNADVPEAQQAVARQARAHLERALSLPWGASLGGGGR